MGSWELCRWAVALRSPSMEPAAPSEDTSPASTVVLPIDRAAAALEVILWSGFPTQFVVVSVLVVSRQERIELVG